MRQWRVLVVPWDTIRLGSRLFREKSGFGDSEQKPQKVEGDRCSNKHHRDRNNAPANHDSRDPEPRADAIENEVAWHLKEAIAEKEHPGTESENSRAELQVGIHLQGGETDVDPVEPGHNVKEKEKRDKAQGDLP